MKTTSQKNPGYRPFSRSVAVRLVIIILTIIRTVIIGQHDIVAINLIRFFMEFFQKILKILKKTSIHMPLSLIIALKSLNLGQTFYREQKEK